MRFPSGLYLIDIDFGVSFYSQTSSAVTSRGLEVEADAIGVNLSTIKGHERLLDCHALVQLVPTSFDGAQALNDDCPNAFDSCLIKLVLWNRNNRWCVLPQ
jgi:hypothetical protein